MNIVGCNIFNYEDLKIGGKARADTANMGGSMMGLEKYVMRS